MCKVAYVSLQESSGRLGHALSRQSGNSVFQIPIDLLSNNLNEHPLAASSIEFAVKDLLPRTEVELAATDCNHHFPAHDLTFHVRVGVVFAGAIVQILGGRLM